MARTPLVRTLRKLCSEHREARARGLPVPALREVRAEEAERASRRGPPPRRRDSWPSVTPAGGPLPRGQGGGPSVAIVGGGLAGLACALSLADRGVHATVFEASNRAGGRIFSNRDCFGGQVAEWGGELIDSGHEALLSLAGRFGLPLVDVRAAEPPGAEETYHFLGAYYPRARADEDFAPVYDAVARDAADAPFPTRYDRFTARGKRLDGTSVHDWIERRVPGGHASPVGALLDVAYTVEYGADTTDQSALGLVYLLAYQPVPGRLAVFGDSDERYRIQGGNQRLTEAIADHLGVGRSVQLGHALVRIRRTAAGRYELTFRKGAGTVVATFDHVVLCLPFAVLREVDHARAGFDARKLRAIAELGRGRNGKTQLQLEARTWNGTGPWPGPSNGTTYADTGYQASWDVTRGQPGESGVLCMYSGGSVTLALEATSPFATAQIPAVARDAASMLARVERVLPGIAARWNGKAIQSIPHRSPFFRLSYSYYRVGQATAFCGHERARQGGVLFAGEHTSTWFQGYMNGAAEEGQRAAAELCSLL